AQAARNRQHRLLAAGEQTGAMAAALAQAGEPVEQLLDLGVDVAVGARVGAEAQVVDDRKLREHLAALGDEDEAMAGNAVRGIRLDMLAEEHHPSLDR